MDNQTTNKNAQSRRQPRDYDPVGDEARLEPTARRPAGNLPVERDTGRGAPSLPGDDRRTETGGAITSSVATTSPLAQMHRLIERAGEEPFASDIQKILSQDAWDDIIQIKPNGALFVSHAVYRDILDQAFGIGGWALIPLEPPRIKGDRAIWYGYLKAHGRYIESAYGGCTYVPKNREMNEDDAVEGAKSDCLVRCCKAFPLFRNLWNSTFCDEWKKVWAYQVENPNHPGRKIWKKKGQQMAGIEGKPGRGYQSEYRKPPRIEDENQAHIDAIEGNRPLRAEPQPSFDDDAEVTGGWEEDN